MKHFLRWWYRVTGQKDEAEFMLGIAKLLDNYPLSDKARRMFRRWRAEYGHIYDLYHGDTQP